MRSASGTGDASFCKAWLFRPHRCSISRRHVFRTAADVLVICLFCRQGGGEVSCTVSDTMPGSCTSSFCRFSSSMLRCMLWCPCDVHAPPLPPPRCPLFLIPHANCEGRFRGLSSSVAPSATTSVALSSGRKEHHRSTASTIKHSEGNEILISSREHSGRSGGDTRGGQRGEGGSSGAGGHSSGVSFVLKNKRQAARAGRRLTDDQVGLTWWNRRRSEFCFMSVRPKLMGVYTTAQTTCI